MLDTQGLPVWKKILQWINRTNHRMLVEEGLYGRMNKSHFSEYLGFRLHFTLHLPPVVLET